MPILRAASAALFCFVLLSCQAIPTGPVDPPENDEDDDRPWKEVIASDPAYPPNVYLTAFVEWSPGPVGIYRQGANTDDQGRPLGENTTKALGPPEGEGSARSGGDTCPVGIGGWGVWRFDEGWAVIDGPGEDFVTFTSTFSWGGAADSLVCELAHVQVSQDGTIWYENAEATFAEHPDPGTDNGGYRYEGIAGLHGNAPTWANFRRAIQAEELVDQGDRLVWEEIPGNFVGKYFEAADPHLGGVRFDLATFVSVEDAGPWPSNGRMRYLKIIDDPAILDGQDYAVDWCLGANLQSAMGINVLRDDS